LREEGVSEEVALKFAVCGGGGKLLVVEVSGAGTFADVFERVWAGERAGGLGAVGFVLFGGGFLGLLGSVGGLWAPFDAPPPAAIFRKGEKGCLL
jgi:hypothetical protein